MRTPTFSDDEAIDALTAAGGIVATAAERLGVTRQALNKRIRASEALQAAKDDARAVMLDEAEAGLFAAVKAGKPWAIRFALARLGKDRGYSLNVNVTGQVEQAGRVVLLLPDNGRDEPDENGPPRMTLGEYNATLRPSSN